MNSIYEWDDDKNKINIKKHGISFNEAKTAFDDRNSKLTADIKHSYDEERFILLGRSKNLGILVVCYCCRENDTITRLISARKANKAEIAWYYGGLL
jgi:hypothetical protein